jgi:hypothetical protein
LTLRVVQGPVCPKQSNPYAGCVDLISAAQPTCCVPKLPIREACCAGWLAPKRPPPPKALPAAGVLAAPNRDGVLAAVPPNKDGVLAAVPPNSEPAAAPPPKSELLDAAGVLAAPNGLDVAVELNRLGVDAASDAPNRLGVDAGVPNRDGVEAAGAA